MIAAALATRDSTYASSTAETRQNLERPRSSWPAALGVRVAGKTFVVFFTVAADKAGTTAALARDHLLQHAPGAEARNRPSSRRAFGAITVNRDTLHPVPSLLSAVARKARS